MSTHYTSVKAPAFFISHGAPTFAIEPGLLGPRLRTLGEQLPDVKAIAVVSPHWQTRDVRVMSSTAPETVHDFGGFPSELYDLQYPAPGHPGFAREAARLLSEAGFATALDEHRGLDHGAWVPLRHLFPQANVPVFQISMPASLDTTQALRLGQALAPLREQGVMIVGSGSMTHNLYEFRHASVVDEPYAREFAAWVGNAVADNAVEQLVLYRATAPHAKRAHPTEEHFLPLLVALGARTGDDAVQRLEGGVTHGVLDMDSYAWGMESRSNQLV